MASSSRTIRVKFDGDASGVSRAADQGSRALDNLRDGLDRADRSLRATAATSGRSADKMAHNLGQVDTRIATVKARLAELNHQFAETGDIKLFGDMAADRRLLSQLERVRKEIDKVTERAGHDGGDNLRTGLSGGFINGAKDMLKRAGKLGAGVASGIVQKIPGALGGALGALPPQAQVAIVGGIVAALIAGSSLIGATLAGALLAGVGTGVLAGGVALAFRDKRIKDASGDLGKMLLRDLEDAAGVFTGPVLTSIGIVRNEWKKLAPDIKSAFSKVSPFLADMTRGLMSFVQRMMPGLLSALGHVGPILTMIGEELGDLGAAFGTMFRDIGKEASGGRLALRFFFNVLEGGIIVVGKTLAMLEGTFETFSIAAALATGNVGLAMDIYRGRSQKTAEQNVETGNSFQRLSEAQQREILALGSGSVALQGFRDRTEILNGSMLGAIQKAGSLAAALDLLHGKTLTAREASRNYQAAIDAVSASLQANGRDLREGTEAGRANLSTLDGLAKAAIANADAIFQNTAQTGNTTLAQQKATAAFAKGREELIKAYMQFDNNRGRAIAYADSIMGIPKTWTTNVNANVGPALAKLQSIAKTITNMDGRTITVYTRETKLGEYIPGKGTNTRRWGGIDHHMARGGMIDAHFTRSPRVLYGERETGGEAFIPRKGDLMRSRRIATTVVRDWLGGDVSWATRGRGGATPGAASGGGDSGGGMPEVRVYIGERELTDMVRVEVSNNNRDTKRRASVGSGSGR